MPQPQKFQIVSVLEMINFEFINVKVLTSSCTICTQKIRKTCDFKKKICDMNSKLKNSCSFLPFFLHLANHLHFIIIIINHLNIILTVEINRQNVCFSATRSRTFRTTHNYVINTTNLIHTSLSLTLY
jgi:hypothetical protein